MDRLISFAVTTAFVAGAYYITKKMDEHAHLKIVRKVNRFAEEKVKQGYNLTVTHHL